jgi:hypothetical protein
MLASMTVTQAEKIRENRLRLAAKRQGYMLAKNRQRDPLALNYGRWKITDPATSAAVAHDGSSPWLTLDQAEGWLTRPETR